MASPQVITGLSGATSPTTNTAGATFVADYFKLASPNYSSKQLKAFRVVCLLYYYQTVTDYRTRHNLLVSDAKTYMRGISNFNLDVALAVTDWNASEAQILSLDSTIATDITAILNKGADFMALPELELDKIIAFLRAQLAV